MGAHSNASTAGTPHISGRPVLIVSVVAAFVMAVGALISAGAEDLHMRSVLLDTIADALTLMWTDLITQVWEVGVRALRAKACQGDEVDSVRGPSLARILREQRPLKLLST